MARSEAFVIAQIEAMACGAPVASPRLTTRVVYANEDDVSGLTAPPASAASSPTTSTPAELLAR